MIRKVVDVLLDDRSYPIYIGDNILHGFTEKFQERFSAAKAAVVTNPTVWDFYGNMIVESLEVEENEYDLIIVPDGENAKSLGVAEKIYGELLEKNFERNDVIVALGGGVVGDLAGFVAATYQRGVPFVQVPTTLLAQVDSSVGGKVAVNHPLGKNMIGAFYQPSFVFIDVATLLTLSEQDFSGGMAEVIKYGFLKGDPFLSSLLKNKDELWQRQVSALSDVVKTCCSIKAEIVQADEKDTGIRAHLNYGHTLAHAIESTSKYAYTHGQAVAIGMVFAACLARELKMIDNEALELHRDIIKAYGLPVALRNGNLTDLILAMEHDKKRQRKEHSFVLLNGIGNPVVKKIDEDILRLTLSDFLKEG